jgi:hypothetical protein
MPPAGWTFPQGNIMIDLIIWSMDRAAQLDALLRSLDRFANGIFNPWIVYKTSNKDFLNGYKRFADLKFSFEPFFAYQNIKGTTFESLTKLGLSEGKEDWVAFSTDDTILHKLVDTDILKEALPILPNQVFSLRLGYNTLIQDCHKRTVQPPLNQHINHGKWLSWNIDKYHPHENYGYPFGLDLHVFRRELIVPILEEIEFSSTNDIESQLTTNYRSKIDELRSFENSCAVNIPINTVTGITRAGERHPVLKEELNRKWLEGWKIDLEDIMKTEFFGCHQEHKFNWSNT